MYLKFKQYAIIHSFQKAYHEDCPSAFAVLNAKILIYII